jgi:hypothetical protein
MRCGNYLKHRHALNAFPTWPQIRDYVEWFAETNHDIAQIETIGHSKEGRVIRAISVTDSAHSIEDKEIALIILGRHGDELGTRAVAIRLLEWLASQNAVETLSRQQIIVVPVANPDGCAGDVFGLPGKRLSRMEKDSVVKLGLSCIPDAVIDVHSVGKGKYGYNWGGLEAVIYDEAAQAGEDQYILHSLADQMIQGAAQQGFPFLLHPISFYRNLKQKAAALTETRFNNHVNQVFYDAFHALTFGIEVNHFVMDAEAAAQSGVAAITALLEAGNVRFPWDYLSGYPNKILLGDFSASLRPCGHTAIETRASRHAIWANRNLFRGPFPPYRQMENNHSTDLTFTFTGERPLKSELTAAIRLKGKPKIVRVEVNGSTTPYAVRRDNCSSYLFIDFEHVGNNRRQAIHIDF